MIPFLFELVPLLKWQKLMNVTFVNHLKLVNHLKFVNHLNFAAEIRYVQSYDCDYTEVSIPTV